MTIGIGVREGSKYQRVEPIKDGQGICEIYYGNVCRRYIGHRKVYVHSNESQKIIEAKLNQALTVIEHSDDIAPKCTEYAIPSLCFSSFPLCPGALGNPEENLNFVSPRRLCREECELLEHDLCRQEYAIAKRHPLIGQQLPIPECSHLPALGSKESATCIRLGLPHLGPILEDHTCFDFDDMRGVSYRGTTSETAQGEPCRPWSHQMIFKSSEYPELLGGHNFCRNPGGIEKRPFCFSDSNNNFRRELCNVPQCGLFGFENKYWVYASGGVLIIAALFLMTLFYCCFRKHCCKSKKKRKSGAQIDSSTSNGSLQTLEMNTLIRKSGKIIEIPLGNIQFLQELGEGAFGKVYKGEAIFNFGETPIPIAIKTLKASATQKTKNDFFRECELMSELKHPNIVCLLGVVTKEEPRSMLFEYMSQGDLHEFLLKHSPRSDPNDFGAISILDQNEMLYIACQIATGMSYLAGHHYCHRDLAARNCLVGEGLVVKIADFGLSRDVYSSDYYRVQSTSLLPIRWMDCNSILYGKFSTETDIWSFGVVLWEIYSYGLQPYYGYSNQEVIEMVQTRSLLPCPDNCPPRIYALMVECWTEVQSRRPSFEELSIRLKQWLMPMPCLHSHSFGDVNNTNSNRNFSSNQQLFGSIGSNGKGLGHYAPNSPHMGRWVEGSSNSPAPPTNANGYQHNTLGNGTPQPQQFNHIHHQSLGRNGTGNGSPAAVNNFQTSTQSTNTHVIGYKPHHNMHPTHGGQFFNQ